jgi:hypothetical protein
MERPLETALPAALLVTSAAAIIMLQASVIPLLSELFHLCSRR